MKEPTSVTISSSDVDCINEFYKNFGFEMPQELADAIEAFKDEETLINQRELTKQLTIAITNIEDPTLKSLFEPVIGACRKSACELQFADDIDNMLAVKPDEEVE